MSFKDLTLSYSYETGDDDPVNDFYIPVLSESKSYDRIAGYFSSSSLAISARGIAHLINNGGKMRILASPNLSYKDLQTIEKNSESLIKYSETKFMEDIDLLTDSFQRDHLSALGWLISNNLLEIKLVIVMDELGQVNENALFHQKIGILEDHNNNFISFSGSINETASGWLNNVEEFKVFKSWIDGQNHYLTDDKLKFDVYWNSESDNLKVLSVSEAVKEKLVKLSDDFDVERFIAKKYITNKKAKTIEEKLNLFTYQKEAVDVWIENDKSLLFEMATGTGKTRTAIGCINEILRTEKSLLCIVACPQGTLSRQWMNEIDSVGLTFEKSLIIDGTNTRWRQDLKSTMNKMAVGYYTKVILYTTHTTCSKSDFTDLIISNKDIPVCFVGDEAHGLGSYSNKKGLVNEYQYRIGLSATPQRWFDDIGTHKIIDYFGNKSFVFTIGDALSNINPLTGKPFLVNYYYNPVFLELDDEEFSDYEKLTKRISKLSSCSKNSDEYQKNYESLLFARANIQKNAVAKYDSLEKVLEENGPINDTIVFTSSEQIDKTMEILRKKEIVAHRYTQDQGTSSEVRYSGRSERQYLIDKFKKGIYQSLVAIKCLDEGIDIPSASKAILMSNSTNPREYIQRIGRVIRQSEGKTRAHIFDFIVEPNIFRIRDPELKKIEVKIFGKELKRVEDMSSNAINNAEVLNVINGKIGRLLSGVK